MSDLAWLGARNRLGFFDDCAGGVRRYRLLALVTLGAMLEPKMKTNPVTLTQGKDGWWVVGGGRRSLPRLSFKMRAHGLAFARAHALSRRATLYVANCSGRLHKQIPASLTYPATI